MLAILPEGKGGVILLRPEPEIFEALPDPVVGGTSGDDLPDPALHGLLLLPVNLYLFAHGGTIPPAP